ncbi:hypothetical protein GH714_025171 [Hevea brasiliensis]|uniref:Uncharacterized protein n=1 Tax=Hevea brasiliensis TaxID=3981 RepID=A0A6A6N6R4_HEVBR|nr:hypothetical protein GH714_024022 [Hevea brasiliensis]KAF2320139.1 hypothetical protein GH714_024250 [Hevea brasiliensis]KAF2320146.1 hypothetical protein GH714_024324 [Hevea brasiliensis]KAF2320172.1 hypothetical protein GH714_024958 [Hevea brasiliensis]KAF2320173.1 hypothetical protein GH714_024974 [Hevea brasiliensis]
MTIEKLSEFEITNMAQVKCCVAGECDKLQAIVNGDQMVTNASGEIEVGLKSIEYLLEELTVDDCSEVTRLVSCNDSGNEIKHVLPALKKVSLHFLPELDSISDVLSISPRMDWMSFYHCPNLKSLPICKVFHTKLRQIKGEESWWQALEWQNTEQDSWEGIFTPVDECD